MKIKILFILSLFTLNVHAELPPQVYENYQKNAPEVLTILVEKVGTSLLSLSEKSVTVTAKVIRVTRSKSHLKRGNTITINYHTSFWKPIGCVGPSSLPILEENETYTAFLKKGEKNHYHPAARGKSFKN